MAGTAGATRLFCREPVSERHGPGSQRHSEKCQPSSRPCCPFPPKSHHCQASQPSVDSHRSPFCSLAREDSRMACPCPLGPGLSLTRAEGWPRPLLFPNPACVMECRCPAWPSWSEAFTAVGQRMGCPANEGGDHELWPGVASCLQDHRTPCLGCPHVLGLLCHGEPAPVLGTQQLPSGQRPHPGVQAPCATLTHLGPSAATFSLALPCCPQRALPESVGGQVTEQAWAPCCGDDNSHMPGGAMCRAVRRGLFGAGWLGEASEGVMFKPGLG